MMEQKSAVLEHDLLAPVTHPQALHFTEAHGAAYTDGDGQRYLDFNEMCQVLGQHNEAFIAAMTRALEGVTTGKTGISDAKEELYGHLLRTTNGDFEAIHLTTSGSEAVEWAVRLACRMTGKTEIVSFWNSIHGRTQLAASLSGLPRRKAGYGPLTGGGVLVPYPRCSSCPVRDRCREDRFPCLELAKEQYRYGSAQDAAAVLVEPYQGARIDIPPRGWFRALERWAADEGMLLIVDEVQSGVGRCGEMYCYQRLGLHPDMLLLGKTLGNGLHISALLMRTRPAEHLLPAVTGGVGDDPLACAAACEVFRQLDGGLLDHVRAMGAVLEKGIAALAGRPGIADVRAFGLACAVEFADEGDCIRVHRRMRDGGFFVGRSGNCLFCKPPYIVTEEQISALLQALDEAIAQNN